LIKSGGLSARRIHSKAPLAWNPLATRLAHARKIAAPYPFLRVLTPEAGLPQNYTYNTLTYLKKTMPLARLIWVMGADNLDQFSRWHRHQDMIRYYPLPLSTVQAIL
jgi:nicotinate-nucleotide adenylyltransferase